MIKELFETEKKILDNFFNCIDVGAVEKLFDILKNCEGLILTTGVGKSGLVAEKIALTLTSTGTRAFFLSPINALHGDIGSASEGDVFLLISKSGESEELLQMIPFLKKRGVKPIAIVNQGNSRLAKQCDMAVVLPLERELCPHNLVPTTSAVTQMIFGSALAVGLMKAKNFSVSDYAMNHPAGKIGRRLTLKVDDLMLKNGDVPLCSPDDKLVDILVELSNKKCGCMLVADKNKRLLGIFTDGDLRRALQDFGSKALESKMESLMTKTTRFISSNEMASTALAMMETGRPIMVLPVVEKDREIIGLIKMHDILQSGL